MTKKDVRESEEVPAGGKPSALVDTGVIYRGDNLDQLGRSSMHA